MMMNTTILLKNKYVENSRGQNVTLKFELDIYLEDPIFIVAKVVKFDILDY